MELNRKERILKLIVEEFVKNAEPVGSSTLIEKYGLKYSSATIRNEMAELEKMGYIEKTHTSSGRVPSSKGYRYYVDYLKENTVDEEIKNQLQTIFNSNQSLTIDEAIKHSCEIISHLTNLTSVVLGPDANTERMQKIQLIKIDDNSAVAVFVTDQGHVEHKTFIVPNDVSFSDLETTMNIINDRIVGTPVAEVIDKVNSLKPILAEKIQNFEVLFKGFIEAFLKFTYERVSVFGRDRLFEHKEFTNDVEKMRKFINMLDSSDFLNLLSNKEGVKVQIGSENSLIDLDDVSVVSADIKIGDNQKGTISLIGPTRMDYSRAISAIEYVQDVLDEFFKEESDGD